MPDQIDNWIARLKKAFDKGLFGWGTDEDEVISVLTEAQGKMLDLSSRFAELEDELIDEFSRKERKQVMRLFHEFTEEIKTQTSAMIIDNPQWPDKLREAFDHGFLGWATDEDAMMEVLQQAKSVFQMCELTNSFKYNCGSDLEDELYSELSGDELRDALRLYYGGFTPVVQGGVCKVHATLAPRFPFKRWERAVTTALSALQQKIESGDQPQFGLDDRDVPDWIFLSNEKSKGHGAAYRPADTPFKSVTSTYDNLKKWRVDCATYAEVALLYIWLKFLDNEKKFNKKFDGLILYDQHSKMLPMQPAITTPNDDGGYDPVLWTRQMRQRVKVETRLF